MHEHDDELTDEQERAEVDQRLREIAEAEAQRKRENAEFLKELQAELYPSKE